jgi:hypothetical protein
MSIVELKGWIDENGQLELEQPTNLPPGEVRVIIESVSPEEVAADEALWDGQFARSQDVLDQMSKEAHEEYLSGLTEDFDPDTEEP